MASPLCNEEDARTATSGHWHPGRRHRYPPTPSNTVCGFTTGRTSIGPSYMEEEEAKG